MIDDITKALSTSINQVGSSFEKLEPRMHLKFRFIDNVKGLFIPPVFLAEVIFVVIFGLSNPKLVPPASFS